MIELFENGAFLYRGTEIVRAKEELEKKIARRIDLKEAAHGTIAYQILRAHNTGSGMEHLRLRFDSMTSHDISYVSIIQTARASGMKEFPVPYALTNCHNSLCAIGGTINEDDHKFALSASHKYGGIYVPPMMANIHSFNQETMTSCGNMILGSDSHTRYGALGTMAVGEGGGELVKQLLGKTYDFSCPKTAAVYLHGELEPGVGPHDVALSLIKAVYKKMFVKNTVLEFVGPGISGLSMDFRNAIDTMTTETACWSSIWCTDEKTKGYYEAHQRPEGYRKLEPAEVAYYDKLISIDLACVECSIALPMHPSNVYTIRELQENPEDILREVQDRANAQLAGVKIDLLSKIHNGSIWVDQGEIAGCAGGTFENICAAADILRGRSCGNGVFSLGIYPGSMPIYAALARRGIISDLVASGAVMRECFCGPCFGAGECPADGELSVRHITRNFPNREGSQANSGQMSSVALMDSRSIAATAANGGRLTAATQMETDYRTYDYEFDGQIYDKRVYNGWGRPEGEAELKFGPNIKDWPNFPELSDDLLVKISAHITDAVTTTDELIPSGESSSYRSDPEKLSEFTLSRRDPEYVGRCRQVLSVELEREKSGRIPENIADIYRTLTREHIPNSPQRTVIGTALYAVMPGDGSAREQAASCQRVLGGAANFARQYATKRYRSNCINWGIIPFQINKACAFALDSYVFIPDVRGKLLRGELSFEAFVVAPDHSIRPETLSIEPLTEEEREIIAAGCLINYYRK